MFEIEKNVPICGLRERYPFKKMEIGDSFSYSNEMAKKVMAAACFYGKRNNKEFSTRTTKTGGRCWRIK